MRALAPVFAFTICFAAATSCAPVRRRAPPAMMQPPAPAFDPTAAALLERCDQTLRAIEPALSQPRADAFGSLARQRLSLAKKAGELDEAFSSIDARIHKARKALRALARSEHEQAVIGSAIIDLEEGGDPGPALPSRVQSNESFRDLVEAQTQKRKNRAERARVEAQLDAIDETFSSMPQADPPHASPYPPPPGPNVGF